MELGIQSTITCSGTDRAGGGGPNSFEAEQIVIAGGEVLAPSLIGMAEGLVALDSEQLMTRARTGEGWLDPCCTHNERILTQLTTRDS